MSLFSPSDAAGTPVTLQCSKQQNIKMEPTINPEETPQPRVSEETKPSADAAAGADTSDSEPLYSGPADDGKANDSEPAFLAYIRPSFWD